MENNLTLYQKLVLGIVSITLFTTFSANMEILAALRKWQKSHKSKDK